MTASVVSLADYRQRRASQDNRTVVLDCIDCLYRAAGSAYLREDWNKFAEFVNMYLALRDQSPTK